MLQWSVVLGNSSRHCHFAHAMLQWLDKSGQAYDTMNLLGACLVCVRRHCIDMGIGLLSREVLHVIFNGNSCFNYACISHIQLRSQHRCFFHPLPQLKKMKTYTVYHSCITHMLRRSLTAKLSLSLSPLLKRCKH